MLTFLELVLLVVDNSVSFVNSSLSQLFLGMFLLIFRLEMSHILIAIAQVHKPFARVLVGASAEIFYCFWGCRQD